MTTTKADDVLELGRARALLGCSSTMTLIDGVRAATSSITELRGEVDRLRAIVHGLTAELAAERVEKERAR